MAKGKSRDRPREPYWRRTVREQRGGGLTIRGFCRKSKLRESAFHFWRREVERRGAEQEPRRGGFGLFLRPGGRLRDDPLQRVHLLRPILLMRHQPSNIRRVGKRRLPQPGLSPLLSGLLPAGRAAMAPGNTRPVPVASRPYFVSDRH